VRAESENKTTDKYLVSCELYLVKKKSGARIQESEALFALRIADSGKEEEI